MLIRSICHLRSPLSLKSILTPINPSSNPTKIHSQIPPFSRYFSSSSVLQRKQLDQNDDGLPDDPPRLFVIQPRIRPETHLKAKLEEALNLANSLEQQHVGFYETEFLDKELPPHLVVQNPAAKSHRADTYFGGGTVETVKCHLYDLESKDVVDAIFVNAILTGFHLRNLERIWGKPVLDRVGLIIKIFNAHAQTKEAKLQAELTALMYKRSRLVRVRGPDSHYTFGGIGEAEVVGARGRGSGGSGFINGAGETEIELQRRRLLPVWKDGIVFKHSSISRFHLLQFVGVSCIRKLSTGTDQRSREIDFELLFNACTKSEVAKRLHALLIVSGKAQSTFVATRLVNIYAHLGNVSLSRDTFDQVPKKDSYTWNSMLSGYVRNRHFSEAVKCAFDMLSRTDVRPDFHTFPPVLKACNALHDGARLHCWVLKLGFEWDVFVAASLVHMYCRFGFAGSAYIIFKDMPLRDVGCWNSMISGFFQNGNAKEALSIVDDMILEGIEMDSVTVATILSICAQMNDLLRGMMIHLYAIKYGLEFNVFVSNALINMYAKFGELKCAQNVFDHMYVRDIVSWNSIIAAYEQNDYPHDAIKFFLRMQSNKVQPDLLTLVSLSCSAAQTKDVLCSKSVHGFIMRRCWITKDTVIGNGIVDMYAKLGTIDSAYKVFEGLPCKDVISWNTMITGYAQNGFASEAIKVYCKMKERKDVKPNQATWVSILPAYAHLGAMRDGMRIHGQVLKENLDLDVFVGTCLIDLYGKCARLSEAASLFYQIPRETSVPWNAIISCHGLHGLGETSLKLFGDMIKEGVEPDHVTFLSLLNACSHSGLVDQGKWYFNVMQQEYGIRPTLKHYGCMVDMFGRAGLLKAAYNFIESMPLRPDASVWGALLGACRIHGNVEMGRKASNRLFELNSEDVGYYVLMSNLYANFGRWEGVGEVRSLARDRGLWKTPGWSSIELNNRIEVFYTGDQSHPQYEEIHKELAMLNAKIKSLGYTPDFGFVLQDVEDDEKENILANHSERLAIMYGILNTPPKTSVRIYKNLRVCGDCHSVTKFISKLTKREIIVRDSNRFHHFKDGLCSCGDYW